MVSKLEMLGLRDRTDMGVDGIDEEGAYAEEEEIV